MKYVNEIERVMVLNKTEKLQMRKWIRALRSGKFKQSRCSLQDDYGFCCLGVACKVLIPENKQKLRPNTKQLYGGMPTNQPNSPRWLNHVDDDIYVRTEQHLTSMNDNLNKRFKGIATLLEKTYLKKKKS